MEDISWTQLDGLEQCGAVIALKITSLALQKDSVAL